MSGKNNFEILEHTADISIRIKGNDLADLFKNAGLAIFQIAARKQYTKNKLHQKVKISLKAQDLEELFINWLNELLSLSAVKGLVFHDLKIIRLENNNLQAIAVGSDIQNYKIHTEIKAATYHQLKLEETDKGWQAEVILDV